MRNDATTQRLVVSAIAEARESSNGWWRTNCPICPLRAGKSDSRLSLAFSPTSGNYRCLRCRVYGWLRGNFQAMLDANPAPTTVPEEPTAMDPPEGFIELGRGPGSTAFATISARRWLEGRGVSHRTCVAARIGVCFSGYFRNRIVIPVLDPFDPDRWLGYVGRALDDQEPRYLYPQGMQRGKLLYNGAELHRISDDPVILVEGCLDALPHFPHTVAGLGKPTETQLEMLRMCKRPVVVCLDGDAWAEGLAYARTLALDRPNVGALRLPPRIDPGNLPTGSLLKFALSALRSEDQPYVV
jgi:hypothetical protein